MRLGSDTGPRKWVLLYARTALLLHRVARTAAGEQIGATTSGKTRKWHERLTRLGACRGSS